MERSTRSGLSLPEIIIVLGVVALVIALFLPATRRVRFAAARLQCQNNLKQLMIGIHGYADVDRTDGRSFPAGCFGPGNEPEDRLSWMVALLPYLDSGDLYNQFDLEAGYTGNPSAARTVLPTFLCPTSGDGTTGQAVTNYVAMAGVGQEAAARPAGAGGNGFMGYDRRTTAKMITDGPTNTIALMETRSGVRWWARGGSSTVRGFDPADLPWCGDGRPFGGHNLGVNVAMADGSVRFLRSDLDPTQLAAAITIAGGEPVKQDD